MDMAADAGTAMPTGNWVGDALDGAGSWALRSRIPYLLGLLMLFDSWDSVVIAYTLPAITAEWTLDPTQGGWLISSGYAGQLVGALAFGALSETRGRMPVLRPLVIAMGLLVLLSAFSQDLSQLIAIRFVLGLMIGGALPIAVSYVNEVSPGATRARFFGTFQFLMLAGFGFAALAGRLLVPEYGWRPMFMLGGLPLLLVPFLYHLPESPRWLATRGRLEEAEQALHRLGAGVVKVGQALASPPRVPLATLFEKPYRSTVMALGAMWFLTSLVSFGLLNWLPSIYVSIYGLTVEDSLSLSAVISIFVFTLPLLVLFTNDRIGRRPLPLWGTAIGGLALLVLMPLGSDQMGWVIALAVLGQVGISIGSIVIWPFSAETLDTNVRSVALGFMSSLARAGAMLAPLLVGVVLDRTGEVTLVFLTFGIASLVVALLWWRWARETVGRNARIGETA
jgi:putative MFS transporter